MNIFKKIINKFTKNHHENDLTSVEGIKHAFSITRKRWDNQYHELRVSIAQLVEVYKLREIRFNEIKINTLNYKEIMDDSIKNYKNTKLDSFKIKYVKYFKKHKSLCEDQEKIEIEITNLGEKIEAYIEKLGEMQDRIHDLNQKEAEAIADISSTQQLIEINDKINNLKIDNIDKGMQLIEENMTKIISETKITQELSEDLINYNEKSFLNFSINAEAVENFENHVNNCE